MDTKIITTEYLKKKLEEHVSEATVYFEIFKGKEIPSKWLLYHFDRSDFKKDGRYTIIFYKPKSDEMIICSNGIAVYDSKQDSFIDFGSCND